MGKPSPEQCNMAAELRATESWADVPGYEGLYQVSDGGHVMRLATYVTEYTSLGEIVAQTAKPEYVLKLSNAANGGYLCCGLTKGGSTVTFKVHRLVAQAFCEKQSEAQTEVHHINGMREDARAANLIWVTPEDHQKLHEARPRVHKYPTYHKRTQGQ